MKDDHRSPAWVMVLVLLLHAELWLAFGAAVVSLAHLLSTAEALGVQPGYFSEKAAGAAQVFVQAPSVFVILPAIDFAVLVALHRFLPNRVARVVWSVLVAGVLLLHMIWANMAHGMMLEKIRETLTRPAPPAAPAR